MNDKQVLELLFSQQKEHFNKSLEQLSTNIDLKFKGVYEHIEAGIIVQNNTIEFMKEKAKETQDRANETAQELSNVQLNCAKNSKLHQIFDGPQKWAYFLGIVVMTALLVIVLNEAGLTRLLTFIK